MAVPLNKDSFITPASIYMVSLSLIQLPLNKERFFHHSRFYLYSLPFINLASTYTVFFSSIQIPLSKDSFITPASIFMISCSLFPLPLNKDCFITPASVYTAFPSSLQILFIQGVAARGSGGFWERRAVTVNTQHANLFNITRIRSSQEVDRLVCSDIMCTTFLLGDIIVMRHFCLRHYDGNIFTATFCSQHFQLEPKY